MTANHVDVHVSSCFFTPSGPSLVNFLSKRVLRFGGVGGSPCQVRQDVCEGAARVKLKQLKPWRSGESPFERREITGEMDLFTKFTMGISSFIRKGEEFHGISGSEPTDIACATCFQCCFLYEMSL